MKDRDAWLGLGIFLILLGTLSALGAVSLGSSSLIIRNGNIQGPYSWLVYNSFLILASLASSFFGAYSFYLAGKSSVAAMKKLPEKEEQTLVR